MGVGGLYSQFLLRFVLRERILKQTQKGQLFAIVSHDDIVYSAQDVRYRSILQSFHGIATNSSIVQFFYFLNTKNAFLPFFYAKFGTRLPYPLRVVFFYVTVLLQFVMNYFLFTLFRLLRFKYSTRGAIEKIDTRNFLFHLLQNAEKNKQRILYLDMDSDASSVMKTFVKKMYPQLDFMVFDTPPYSLSIGNQNKTFFEQYPQFWEMMQFVQLREPDIVLVPQKTNKKLELEFVKELKQRVSSSFFSLLLVDTKSIITDSKKSSHDSRKVFFTLTLDQFLYSLQEEKKIKTCVSVRIQNEKGEILVLPKYRSLSTFQKKNENLESVVSRLLLRIARSTENFALYGKPRKKNLIRTNATLQDIKKNRYDTAAISNISINFTFHGDMSQLDKDVYFAPVSS